METYIYENQEITAEQSMETNNNNKQLLTAENFEKLLEVETPFIYNTKIIKDIEKGEIKI